MKASEIIRRVADMLDAQEAGASTETNNLLNAGQVDVTEPTDTNNIEARAQVNTKTMVPPLQQKLDLIKKMAGVEGPCTSCGCDPCGCPEPQDELEIIKQNAGIKPLVVVIADEDEPFEG